MIQLNVNNYSGFQLKYNEMAGAAVKEQFAKECEEHDLECSVCFTAPFINPYVVTRCHHIFCKACIDQVAKDKKNCPLCRGVITDETLAPALDVQECIVKIWNRHASPQQQAPELVIKKIERLVLEPPKVEDLVTLQEKHKYGQLLQSIFSALSDDQSQGNSGHPIFKTTWAAEQRAQLMSLRDLWHACKMDESQTLSSYLDTLETVAFGLVDITKEQISSLRIVNARSNKQEVRTEGCIFKGHMDVKLLNNLHAIVGNKEVHTCVDGVEVRRSDSSFIRACVCLDEVLIDCSAKRFARTEFLKAFIALGKVSSESIEKQHDAFVSVCDYSANLLQFDNLQELFVIYNMLAHDDGGIRLLGKITQNLLCHDLSYKNKIQVILASLDEKTISSLKTHALIDIKEDRDSSLKLLYLCDEHKGWCTKQVCQAIESFIRGNQNSKATRLLDKYLMKYQKEVGLNFIRSMIDKNIKDGYDSRATELIDKYLLNSQATCEEGMNFVRIMINKNIKNGYDSRTTDLIDKYLLNNQATREEGMDLVRLMINKNIKNGYDSRTTDLIDKYLLNNQATREEGMNLVRLMINKNIKDGYSSRATDLIDKYLLHNDRTREEGMSFIRTLISNGEKDGYKSRVADLRQKYGL